MTGVVIRVLSTKGYGFIRSDDGSGNYFFHCSEVKPAYSFDTFREGLPVEFEPGISKKANGLLAVNVRMVNGN
jgi:cold shock CspA family protein